MVRAKKRQQPLCCRPGCGKTPSRSIPASLFMGERTKVCKACYTWMRRHFQVEPNGKHVRCAEHGILDRCASMLEDFAKAGVFPSVSSRRHPNLVLPPSNKLSHHHASSSSNGDGKTTRTSRNARSSHQVARRYAGYHGRHGVAHHHHYTPRFRANRTHHDDGLTTTGGASPAAPPTPNAGASQWVDVEFSELSDSEDDEPHGPVRRNSESGPSSQMSGDGGSTVGEMADAGQGDGDGDGDGDDNMHGHDGDNDGDQSDCDMGQSGGCKLDGSGSMMDDATDAGMEYDALSTSSMTAWRALVEEDGTRMDDALMDLGDYDTLWQPTVLSSDDACGCVSSVGADSDGAPSSLALNFVSGAQPCSSPTATLFPGGVTIGVGIPTTLHPRPRSVTPIRCPRSTGTPRRRSGTCYRGGRVVHGPAGTGRGSPACAGGGRCACSGFGKTIGPSPTPSYAQDVRRAACGSAHARSIDRALTPPRAPLGRVTSTDSLFSCGNQSWVSDNAPPKARPPLPMLTTRLQRDMSNSSGTPSLRRKYGRRAASAGVRRAVEAVAVGDASPVLVHNGP